MELKQAQATGTVEINELLIVPYGIETKMKHIYIVMIMCLLIVPYGIETKIIGNLAASGSAFNCTLWN